MQNEETHVLLLVSILFIRILLPLRLPNEPVQLLQEFMHPAGLCWIARALKQSLRRLNAYDRRYWRVRSFWHTAG